MASTGFWSGQSVVKGFYRFLCRSAFVHSTIFTLASCSALPRIPYSAADATSPLVLNTAGLRRYSDESASSFNKQAGQTHGGTFSYLALSGGGADGAYGAGVLNGWTTTGTRPVFSTVSGVSTGALIAPFAFLGSAYDPVLQEIYTSGIAASLVEAPNVLNALLGSGLFGNSKLRDLVARYIDRDALAAIAAQHARGRVLVVVTTNLDTQRTVIWDMGRIASIGTPEALNLFIDVMTASASIPMVFSPTLIGVEGNGNSFQEMHVDGSVTAPVLTLPEAFLLHNATLSHGSHTDLYILMNSKLERDFQLIPNSTVRIAERASASATMTQTRSVLMQTYDFARRNNLGFNLTFVGKEAPASTSIGFDTDYMRALYQYGYDKARSRVFWAKQPPSDERMPNTVRR